MKSECGGLQTLLRNHNYIFVVASGRVRLRCHALDGHRTGKRRKTSSEVRRKTKRCWFHDTHPDGCSVDASVCQWAHGDDDVVKI